MIEMVNMEEMDVMECLVLKDHKDLQVNLVQQVDLQDLKASQEQREHLAGPQGTVGATGPRSGGVTYTRWGKNTCPNVTGTELI